jgi:hypothetical protein
MPSRYDHLTKDELARLLEARDRRDATRFGLVWEANEIARDQAINSDFIALDFVPELCCSAARAEQSRAEQSRAEQSRAEQSRAA